MSDIPSASLFPCWAVVSQMGHRTIQGRHPLAERPGGLMTNAHRCVVGPRLSSLADVGGPPFGERNAVSQLPVLKGPTGTHAVGSAGSAPSLLELAERRAEWVRLGVELHQLERSAELRAWVELRRWLDDSFRGSVEVEALTVGRRGRRVPGRLVVEQPRALLRVGTFAVARLVPRGDHWSGIVGTYFPGSFTAQLRLTDTRVRVERGSNHA